MVMTCVTKPNPGTPVIEKLCHTYDSKCYKVYDCSNFDSYSISQVPDDWTVLPFCRQEAP